MNPQAKERNRAVRRNANLTQRCSCGVWVTADRLEFDGVVHWCARDEVLSLDELRSLPPGDDFDGGLYFLWLGDTLQYIGRTDHICIRIARHEWCARYAAYRKDGKRAVSFDHHTALVLHTGRMIERRTEWKQRLKELERAYIAAYRPPCNRVVGSQGR